MAWFRSGGPTIPVLRFAGPIGLVTPLRPGLTATGVASAIERAFSIRNAPAVAVLINSPGGSPVQSHLIFKRIRALAEEKSKPVYVFAEDVAASGGYMLALAGDEIYADPSSILGSIGVVSAGFGLDKAIGRYGIERRVYTAGEHKMALDPFQPEKPDEVARLKALQREVHEGFIALVRERRGARLRGEPGELFTGAIWSGRRALELGLIDGLSDVRSKMRELFGEKVRLKLCAQEGGWLRRRLSWPGMGNPFPAPGSPLLMTGIADDLISAIEARALWQRIGF
jgi:signal peptide peptidase SppA